MEDGLNEGVVVVVQVFTEEQGIALNEAVEVGAEVFTEEQRCQQKFSRSGRGVEWNERVVADFLAVG